MENMKNMLIREWLETPSGRWVRISMWAVIGAVLITAGCMAEEVTTVGHHLLLIIAGAAIGIGIYREANK
jgi:hypothetical protein